MVFMTSPAPAALAIPRTRSLIPRTRVSEPYAGRTTRRAIGRVTGLGWLDDVVSAIRSSGAGLEGAVNDAAVGGSGAGHLRAANDPPDRLPIVQGEVGGESRY